MTVRVPVAALSEGERVLDPEASRYLCRVLRLGAGDRFSAFDPAALREADGTVLDAHAAAVRVRFDALREAAVVATAEIVLVYALAKGDKVDAVVRDATELGATRIILAESERSVVKADRAQAKRERWIRVAEQAARQCGRADPPAIDGVLGWADALDRVATAARFCLHPRAGTTLGSVLVPALERGASLAFAIGPEGGLSDEEIALAAARGFVEVTLGRFVLRTETVAAAVLGAVRVLADEPPRA